MGVIAASVGKVAGGDPLGFFIAGLAMAGFALGLLSWLRGADAGRPKAGALVALLGVIAGGVGVLWVWGAVIAKWISPKRTPAVEAGAVQPEERSKG